MPADDRCVRPYRAALPQHGLPHLPVGVAGTGIIVVRKGDVGSNEYVVADGDPVINRYAVLDLAVAADADVEVQIGVLADDAVFTYRHIFTDLGVDPDFAARPD